MFFFFLFYSFIYINTSLAVTELNSSTTEYQNVGSFDGTSEPTLISNTDTGGIAGIMNYLLTVMVVAIIALIIFRILEGAIKKGTFDNIFDQQSGRKSIQNAGIGLLIFILTYAVFSFINPDLTGWTFIEKVSMDTIKYTFNSGGASGSGYCKIDQNYINSNITEMIKIDEGSSNYAYIDTRGYSTIGVGFNYSDPSAKKIMKEVNMSDTDINKVLSCTPSTKKPDDTSSCASITDEQVNSLLEKSINIAKNNAIEYVGGEAAFNALSEKIQKAVIDMSFNLGGNKLKDFKEMLKGIKANDNEKIAYEIINSDYCKQVGDRCGRLVGLVLGTCPTPNTAVSSLATNSADRCKIAATIKESDLKVIDDKGHKLLKSRADEFLAMKEAAAKDGVNIIVTSAYRSDDDQIRTCQSICSGNRTSCPSGPGVACGKACKLGGNGSNHVTGDAIDIQNGCRNGATCDFSSKVAKWMTQNGYKYHFINKLPEDGLHYSSTGK